MNAFDLAVIAHGDRETKERDAKAKRLRRKRRAEEGVQFGGRPTVAESEPSSAYLSVMRERDPMVRQDQYGEAPSVWWKS